jgi:curli production assembly/transport component CsgG
MEGVGVFALLMLVFCTLSSCNMKADGVVNYAAPPTEQVNPLKDRLNQVPELGGDKITVAVYSFTDMTGQRKPSSKMSQLSSAVSQGTQVWVIKALQDVGNGTWFKVVERGNLDALVKERQLIRSTREVYGEKNVTLKPLLFAGLIIEGGIVGYDSNTASGGLGARFFGIGSSTEYRVDTVTVALRVIMVSTGEVLLSVATEKTIASIATGQNAFRFLDLGTRALELERGKSINEPVNYATRAAIEQAVIELVYQGANKGLWSFQGKVK